MPRHAAEIKMNKAWMTFLWRWDQKPWFWPLLYTSKEAMLTSKEQNLPYVNWTFVLTPTYQCSWFCYLGPCSSSLKFWRQLSCFLFLQPNVCWLPITCTFIFPWDCSTLNIVIELSQCFILIEKMEKAMTLVHLNNVFLRSVSMQDPIQSCSPAWIALGSLNLSSCAILRPLIYWVFFFLIYWAFSS